MEAAEAAPDGPCAVGRSFERAGLPACVAGMKADALARPVRVSRRTPEEMSPHEATERAVNRESESSKGAVSTAGYCDLSVLRLRMAATFDLCQSSGPGLCHSARDRTESGPMAVNGGQYPFAPGLPLPVSELVNEPWTRALIDMRRVSESPSALLFSALLKFPCQASPVE
ncbi:hypothetical protein SKAU_G00402060 [Synaphobranchus kaupii]|uniref:Uncharacterized protein n=1 Tax=Synaphobranchus kaupii TaxID=118154 RepID=A0A9Q1E9B6_SYNKA|nr:hypothetical protein SKAU_G00402060 [Synaphobranchus kaupii]